MAGKRVYRANSPAGRRYAAAHDPRNRAVTPSILGSEAAGMTANEIGAYAPRVPTKSVAMDAVTMADESDVMARTPQEMMFAMSAPAQVAPPQTNDRFPAAAQLSPFASASGAPVSEEKECSPMRDLLIAAGAGVLAFFLGCGLLWSALIAAAAWFAARTFLA